MSPNEFFTWVFANKIAVESLVAGAIALAVGGLSTAIFVKDQSNRERELEQLQKALDAHAKAAAQVAQSNAISNLGGSGSTQDTVRVVRKEVGDDRDLIEELIVSYHQQALSQARVQFWFSVAAATIGFLYIIYAAFNINSSEISSYFKISPGVIVDAIAALFFRQAEQTRQRATELYDRLRKDRELVRAETVVESIEDQNIRSAVKAQIALHMAGLVPKEIDLKTFLHGSERTMAPLRARAVARSHKEQS